MTFRYLFIIKVLAIASYLLHETESAYVPSTVEIKGNSVYINGSKFFWRGVDYGPTPVGQYANSKAGCCTYDWYSNPTIWNRDLPLIQELNANLIRTYNWRNNMRHDAFLDECYKRGIYVVASFSWDWNLYNTDQQAMKDSLVQMVRNHANHPAIAMWIVGNELNTHGTSSYNPQVWNFVKTLKDLIHATEAPYWHPVGSTLADGNSLWDTINARDSMNTVDVWMVQLYKGKSFYDFWTKYKAASSKPLFITEYGVSAFIAGKSLSYAESQQAEWEQAQWKEMQQHTDILSGVLKFAWLDGWFKCSGEPTTTHDTCSYPSGAFPGGMVYEEWFGMTAFVSGARDPNFDDPIRVKDSYCMYKHEWKSLPRVQKWDPVNLSGCPEETDMIYSVADAVVRPGTYSAVNYGTDNVITLKYTDDPNFYRESFLRFDLSQVSSQGPWNSVKLVLTVSSMDVDVAFPVTVELVNNNAWNEMQITFDNKPTSTQYVRNVTRQQGSTSLSIDVTQVVNVAYIGNMNPKISFRIYRSSGTGERIDFHSRQSASGTDFFPRLELSGVSTTTGTSSLPTTTGTRPSLSTSTSSTSGSTTERISITTSDSSLSGTTGESNGGGDVSGTSEEASKQKSIATLPTSSFIVVALLVLLPFLS